VNTGIGVAGVTSVARGDPTGPIRMNNPTPIRKEPLVRPRVRVWWFLLAALAALIALPIYAVSSLLHIRPETRIVRSAAMEAVAPQSDWHRQIEINVGPVGLGLARLVTAFVDVNDVDEIAYTALSAIHNVQVSVYQSRGPSGMNGRAAFQSAAAAMGGQSWQRVVGVLDGDDTVAVFVPSDLDAEGSIEVCVVVCSEDTLVIAATRADLDALAPLIAQVTARHRGEW